jgi:2-C-methyl-D-erythritol 4-phosphate cytidylyltransferase / 2-C-methyl-D-erythritol 2,4-cyclodiphosphate synthase
MGGAGPGTMPRIAVVVTAAGSSERFGGGKKELLPLGERSVLDRSLSPFLDLPSLEALVVTAPAGREAELRAAISPRSLAALERLGPGRFAVVAGGACRRDSVRLGLEELSRMLMPGGGESADASGTRSVPRMVEALWASTVVLVHDGARPWASAGLAARVAEAAALHGASVPVVPLVDTPKELAADGTVLRHPARAAMGCAQTPQGFILAPLLEAHRRASAEGLDCTDDAELWDRYVGPVASLPGEAANRKLTYAADLGRHAEVVGAGDARNSATLHAPDDSRIAGTIRVGQGWDIHRLVQGRPLMLGGIEVPSDLGEDAHSDGDVLLHAIIDALLGAAAMGDIGTHFPPSDEAWRGADSRDLARRAAALVRAAGWLPGSVDCTVILERPRLGPHRDAMRASIAAALGVGIDAVSVKAKTNEGLGPVGEGRAVEAQAIASVLRGRE